MKNILINTTPLLSPHTGIAKYIYHLSSELLSLDEDYLFYYFEGLGIVNKLRSRHVESLSSFKDQVIKSVPFSRQLLRQIQRLKFNRSRRGLKISLYHEPNYLPISYIYPTVITVHDLSFVRYPETHPADRVRMLERRLPEALERSQAILVDSHFVKSELIDYFGVNPEKIVTHYLAADDVFKPRTAEQVTATLSDMGLKYRKFILLVGTLEPRKNIKQAVDGFRKLPEEIQKNYPLVLVGAKGWGDTDIGQKLSVLISEGKVIVPGYLDLKSLADLYSSASLFVYPSMYEGFGLPPLEAMNSGLPVIVTDTSSLPEVVGDVGIKVELGDVDNLAEKMEQVVSDSGLWNSMSARSIERSGLFTWKECADITLHTYARVMEG